MMNNDEFDRIVDDALAEYRDAEPLVGLEERVMQRLRLQSERRQKLVWRWSAIAALAAALAFVAWIGFSNRKQQPAAPSVAQEQELPAEAQPPAIQTPAASGQSAAKQAPGRNPAAHRNQAPQFAAKRQPPEQFPSSAPLKPEERMLLALATTHPEILRDQADDDKEIVITPINIRPLADETGGPQGEN